VKEDLNDIVAELLEMAKDPDAFSKTDLGEMVLLAATEIIKLRQTTAYDLQPREHRSAHSRKNRRKQAVESVSSPAVLSELL
jgi:hypothetical protein